MSTTPQIYRAPLLYQGQRLERDEFYRRIEQWIAQGKNPRGIERLEGVVYMPASIRVEQHGEPHAIVVTWLTIYAGATPGLQSSGNATSKIDPDNDPESDALLRIRPEYGGQSQTDMRGYIVGAPELLAEVTASSSEKDREVKFEVYRRNGVLEYIIWETLGEEIYWFALEGQDYVRMEPDENGILRSRIFPGLWLDVNAILDGNVPGITTALQQGISTPEHTVVLERLKQARAKAD